MDIQLVSEFAVAYRQDEHSPAVNLLLTKLREGGDDERNGLIQDRGSPVSILTQPLLRGGHSPRITRFGSSWRTDRTHQAVLQARRWGGPRKTSAEFEDQEC